MSEKGASSSVESEVPLVSIVKREFEKDSILLPAGFHYRGGDRLRVYMWEAHDVINLYRGTVVLLHGLLTSHASWSEIASRLAASGWRVIAPDLLGFGESPWPRGASSYTVQRHIDELVTALKPINSRFHIVGHSIGAILAAELVSRKDEFNLDIVSLTTIALPYFDSSNHAQRHLSHASRCCCCASITFMLNKEKYSLCNAAKKTRNIRNLDEKKESDIRIDDESMTSKQEKILYSSASWRASLVWILLNFPIMSFILCSLICQQRIIWFFFARIFGGKVLEQRFKNVLLHSYHSVVASYRHCVENHRLDLTKLNNIPILIAHGRADDVIPIDSAIHFRDSVLASSIESSFPPKLILLDGVKHSCSDAAPAIASLLLKWLSLRQKNDDTFYIKQVTVDNEESELREKSLSSSIATRLQNPLHHHNNSMVPLSSLSETHTKKRLPIAV
uniref:AB hydrolase-1 domain-containing protein n=1 Tax=Aureoumbra lagunensis TaxID=44058 RepID=A0A7S3NPY8_9STRA|mmetsp:Transcript_942/g.1312  ORF Transcript_942/g.1312 Transcript_942/m.1312 type:complete len:448 (+) Transcript_942:79-1422(+)